MALVVEDGTGLANSESYISVADADTYHSDFGHTVWTGEDTVKEAALRNATQYLDSKYVRRWKGLSVLSTQALDWPRTGVTLTDGWLVVSTVIPLDLQHACAELALYALTEDLVPTISDPGVVTFTSIKVGPIEDKVAYSGRSQIKLFRISNELVKDLIIPAGRLTIGQS